MMKKLAIAMMLGIAAMSASAQVNYRMQVACSPQDVKTYDTNRLRSSFLMEKVMVPNEINVTYSMYDRLIFGGAVPATKELVLETIDPLKSKFFLERRELAGRLIAPLPGAILGPSDDIDNRPARFNRSHLFASFRRIQNRLAEKQTFLCICS